jgi:NADPH:quinone reductase
VRRSTAAASARDHDSARGRRCCSRHGCSSSAASGAGPGSSGATEAFELTRRGARFFSYGAANGEFPDIEAEAERRGVRVVGIHDRVSASEQRRWVDAALARVAAYEIRPVIGQAVPLERASEAHAAIEARSVPGKTLLLTAARAKKAA